MKDLPRATTSLLLFERTLWKDLLFYKKSSTHNIIKIIKITKFTKTDCKVKVLPWAKKTILVFDRILWTESLFSKTHRFIISLESQNLKKHRHRCQSEGFPLDPIKSSCFWQNFSDRLAVLKKPSTHYFIKGPTKI